MSSDGCATKNAVMYCGQDVLVEDDLEASVH